MIAKRSLRPVYVIFEGSEALFTNNNAVQHGAFHTAIREVVRANVWCKLLFMVDEDHVDEMELGIRGLDMAEAA